MAIAVATIHGGYGNTSIGGAISRISTGAGVAVGAAAGDGAELDPGVAGAAEITAKMGESKRKALIGSAGAAHACGRKFARPGRSPDRCVKK